MAGVSFQVYNPGGRVEMTETPAKRIAGLRGRKVGLLWNGVFRGDDMFPFLQQLLKERFPDGEILSYGELPSHHPDAETIGQVVKEKGCDAVIAGNGA